jgi:hypothetical protein
MEVHAHTHTPRKKWTHYVWEFLMLFLAVFCGFLAEYQLEHKIEKERGHEYIRSFYEDLKADTASYNNYIQHIEVKLAILRGATLCYDSLARQKKANTPCLADLMEAASGFEDVITEDRTLIQLKNAGGLRLLKKEDADSILRYDRLVRIYTKGETTGYQETQYKLRDMIVSLTNYANFMPAQDQGKTPLLYKKDPELINRFFVFLRNYSIATFNNKESLKVLRQKAISLIKYFKTEYHFQ